MDFNKAWEKKEITAKDADKERVLSPFQIRIDFEDGTASMVFNKKTYLSEAKKTLCRAWGAYCKEDPYILESINAIYVEDIQPVISEKAPSKIKKLA